MRGRWEVEEPLSLTVSIHNIQKYIDCRLQPAGGEIRQTDGSWLEQQHVVTEDRSRHHQPQPGALPPLRHLFPPQSPSLCRLCCPRHCSCGNLQVQVSQSVSQRQFQTGSQYHRVAEHSHSTYQRPTVTLNLQNRIILIRIRHSVLYYIWEYEMMSGSLVPNAFNVFLSAISSWVTGDDVQFYKELS